MTEKYLVGMPPRQGKAATMETLQKMNDSLDISHTVDVSSVEINVDFLKIITAAATKYKCPVCGCTLLFDFEVDDEYAVLFCPKCRKRCKAAKMKG